MIRNYEQAKEFLSRGKDKTRRNVPSIRSTSVIDHGDHISIRYHDTDVIKFYPDHMVIDCNGWRTRTTKERINEVLKPWNVFQNRGVWFIMNYNSPDRTHYLYRDGLTFDYNGNCLSELKTNESEIAKMKALQRQILAYGRKVYDTVMAEEIDPPSGGDCWYCCMVGDDGKTLGESLKDTHHLISHMEESYIVPSLIWNALRTYDNAPLIMQTMYNIMHKAGHSGHWKEITAKRAKRAIVKYLKVNLGVAS